MFDDFTARNDLKEISSYIKKNVKGRIIIQGHHQPDPDSLASAHGLQYLLLQQGIQSKIVYSGEIVKPNLKKMVETFKIQLHHITEFVDIDEKNDLVILVDCQRNNGNVYDLAIERIIVVDHHLETHQKYVHKDIRDNVGACSTIIASYFIQNNIPFNEEVAGALYYGIVIDTENLNRSASQLDRDVFYYLSNKMNPKHMKDIRLSQISMLDIQYYADGLKNVEKYKEIAFAHIANCHDNLLGSLGDILLTIEGVLVVIVYSIRDDGIKFSVRSGLEAIQANKLIYTMLKGIGSGGGHKEMAGGYITRDIYEKIILDKDFDTFIKLKAINYVYTNGEHKNN